MSAAANYTITASNSGGSSSTTINIIVEGIWETVAYIKAPNSEANDLLGYSVSISADTIVVGAYGEDSNQTTITNGTTASADNSAADAGAVYVINRTGTTWAQEAYIKAPNANAGDQFGWSVSISGDTIAVGVRSEDSNQTTITNGTTASGDNSAADAGAVYVFKRTGTTWAQEAYLKAPNANAGDQFGQLVSISSDTIAVGAIDEDSNQTTITNGTTASVDNSATSSGAVYVFKRTGTTWTQEAYLKAPNAETLDNFGFSVSIFGDTIAVGAHMEDSNQTTITNGTTASTDNSASTSGALYVFKRTGTNWAQEAYLKAPNAEANDFFGGKVSISGDTIAVGANQESSNQTTITNGNTASANNSAPSSGAVYVFKRTGTTWAQEAYIKAPNANGGDSFGYSVSISGDTIAVGARNESSNQTTITNGTTASADNSATNSGAAYVFKRTGTTWAQEAYIKAPNAEANDWFGFPVSISGDTIAVGAMQEDSNQTTITNGTTASADNSASSSGAVYVYRKQ
ncbi:MAG: FG-GAP repeat protein [Leptospiraceae bacterium]|nr:FG-GAP repeat protein [Leptospiraceae bacterium]MBK7057713.1 FG-GAP repeat protein [Leptospiraceae bacterium]MBK9497776.1 FG-GAP repeat protein [Leptospiraceae bacterium]MBL0266753.1 FG-GAP repeat protein [Leptospiraceae bacterium]